MIIHNRTLTRVNGPGYRAGLWFQGCSLGCRGCWNQTTHAFTQDNETPENLANWIISQEGIEGVTFSGGEPMQQAQDLLETIVYVRDRRPELSFGMFTGYNLAELEQGRFRTRVSPQYVGGYTWKDTVPSLSNYWAGIRAMIDFAVMGRFQESKTSTADPMRSSTNQKLHLFSSRYTEADFGPQRVEVKIKTGGLTTITGFPVGVKGL